MEMVEYKSSLNQRYWEYQKSQFPHWQKYFERTQAKDGRPPVFLISEAWRNVIVNPDADQQEIDRLLTLVPKPERHKWYRSMNSSQALAQSVFGNLVIHGFLKCLNELKDDEGLSLFGKAIVLSENFTMEHKIDYFGEPRRTSLYGYISGDYRVAIEFKYTEADIGTCSRPRLTLADSNYEHEHCNGTYTKQRKRVNKCSLTEIGVLYWRYVPELFIWKSENDYSPCPLFKNYQLVRNILAVGVIPDGRVSLDNGHVVLIYDERNPTFGEGGKGFIAFTECQFALRNPRMLRKCSLQRIIQMLRSKDVLPFLTEHLDRKYGL
jgi:hypothetical protein